MSISASWKESTSSANVKPCKCGYFSTASSTTWLLIGLQITGTLQALTYMDLIKRHQFWRFPNVFTNRGSEVIGDSFRAFWSRCEIYADMSRKPFLLPFSVGDYLVCQPWLLRSATELTCCCLYKSLPMFPSQPLVQVVSFRCAFGSAHPSF